MNRKEYYDKLRKWEAEGYDVSELREKWFPSRKGKGGSHIGMWLSVVAVIFIAVAGIVVWQAMQRSPTSVPAIRIPSSAPTTTTPTPTPAPSPASATTPIPAQVAVARYVLSISSNPAGAGNISPSGGTYDSGTSVTVIATPAFGYRFDRWSGDFSGTSPTITLTINSNKEIVANFVSIQYTLSTAVSPTGSGSISPSGGSYDSGSRVTLTAIPSSGWRFDRWNGTDDNSLNPSTVTMNGNKNITVYFVAQDTDGDGLTDDEERQIGTNPSYVDTDHDGLNDYQEVKVKKTDPLSPDTDGDGVKDGEDLLPLYDAYVRVSIKYYEDTSTTKYAADSGLISSYADPFFKIRVNGSLQTSNMPVKMDAASLQNPFYATFNVPDNLQFASIEVEVWDYDSFSGNEQFDVGKAAGSDPDALIYKKQFNILGDTITETSDGAADGSMQGPQAKIIVEISTISR